LRAYRELSTANWRCHNPRTDAPEKVDRWLHKVERCVIAGQSVAEAAAASFRCSSPRPDTEAAPERCVDSGSPVASSQMALAAMLTVRASSAALKTNERMPWAATVRRIGLHETATSDTCDVMPITNEK